MKWMVFTLPDVAVNNGAVGKLKEAFEQSYNMAGSPEDAAMFTAAGSDGSVACYFTPGAAKIFAQRLGALSAMPCEPPAADGMTLEAGNEAASGLLG